MSAVNQANNLESQLKTRYFQIRNFTESLCTPLEIEDYCLQSMANASPVKWHLAHTSWFFETFLLKPYLENYRCFNEQFNYLFNSYYNSVGSQFPRPQRGLQSRPTVAEVFKYRAYVDQNMRALFSKQLAQQAAFNFRVELGINHEQQHQELLLTDLKHAWSFNPIYPVYKTLDSNYLNHTDSLASLTWSEFEHGQYLIGAIGDQFSFDNEQPSHQVTISDFQIAQRLTSNGEYLKFVESGGYQDPLNWLSDGWGTIQQQQWKHPFYWLQQDGNWFEYGLRGLQPLNLNQPVCHLSYFEADAFARWSGARLPTEFEWELAASKQINNTEIIGNFIESNQFQPLQSVSTNSHTNQQFFGDCWEWTSSAYSAYPGFATSAGAIGEYNGKFMCNQMVLRGGSCVTSQSHIRHSYRNFFHTDARWQFSGIRLARDI